MNVLIHSNHGHDKVAGKSIAGLLGFIGGIPITWHSKRQSSVMTSTFGTEFISLKKAIEEAVAYRYCCRSFGMRVAQPTTTYEDSMAVVLNSTQPGSNLNHKPMALSYYFCREHVAGGVVEVRHVNSKKKLFNALTKGLDSTDFHNCFIPFIAN